MAFLVFERFTEDGQNFVRPTTANGPNGEEFSLAGYNLLRKAWKRRGRPLNEGWHVSVRELIKIYGKIYGKDYDISTHLFAIDWNPKSKSEIGLIELRDVYAFSFGNDVNGVEWTPLMLRVYDLFHCEYEETENGDSKNRILSRIPETGPDFHESVEFLYLKGDDWGWNWGMNGMTNAAFIYGEARDYFRRFF